MSIATKAVQNQEIKEIKIEANIGARNKSKAAIKADATDQKVNQTYANPVARQKFANETWKQQMLNEPGRVAVQSVFDGDATYPEATNEKVKDLMRQITGQSD